MIDKKKSRAPQVHRLIDLAPDVTGSGQPPITISTETVGTYSYSREELAKQQPARVDLLGGERFARDAARNTDPRGRMDLHGPKKLGRPPLAPEAKRREYASVMLTESEIELVERKRLAETPPAVAAVFVRRVLLTQARKR